MTNKKLIYIPLDIVTRLKEEQIKCGSVAEKDFINWLCTCPVPNEQYRMQVLGTIKTQVRYNPERRFVADFLFHTKKGKKVFIEWEGAIGNVRSAYRSFRGYLGHTNKYNWLACNGFLVIRLCNQNKDTFWELVEAIEDN
jgi:very-short-patch-repair endonuclease